MADLLYDVLRVNDTDANIVGGLIKQLQWAWATDTSKLIARDALGYHKIPSEGIITYFDDLAVGYTTSPSYTEALNVNGNVFVTSSNPYVEIYSDKETILGTLTDANIQVKTGTGNGNIVLTQLASGSGHSILTMGASYNAVRYNSSSSITGDLFIGDTVAQLRHYDPIASSNNSYVAASDAIVDVGPEFKVNSTSGYITMSNSGVVGTFGSTSFNLNPTTVALSDGSETATFQTSGANLPLTRDYKINGESFLVNAKMATGFTDPSAVVVTYDSTARTITLTGTVKAFYQGQEIEALVTSWVSSAHGTGSGSFFLYHDGSTFQWSSTPWDFNEVPIAYVFKNASYQFALREPHGMVMSGGSHKEAHENIGTYIASGAGGDFSGYTLSSTTAADRRPDISALTINDEDIPTTNAQLLESSADYTQFYLSSTDTTNVDESNADIISLSGNQPYFNEFSGGTWGQTLMSNNYYAKIFVLATPASADAESQRKRFLFIQPQSQQATLTACQAITSADISLGELGAALTEFAFCGEIIIRYTAGNWQLIEVNKITGNKLNQTSSVQGNFLSTVSTDATLTGDGTSGSPLSVVSSSQWTTSGSDIYYPTGNVGIGPDSSAPKSLLHIIDNSATEVCAEFSNSLTGTGVGTGLCVGVDASGNALINNYTNSDLIFKTWNGSGGTMVFDNTGNLGINETSPSNIITATRSTNGVEVISVNNSNTGTQAEARLQANASSNNLLFRCFGSGHGTASGENWIQSTVSGTDMVFYPSSTGEALRLNSDLSISMPAVYSDTVGVTNRDLYIDDTGKLGYVSSSKRYKENIKYDYDTSFIYDLKPCTFNYKKTNILSYGLIAEDVEKINKDFVIYENEKIESVKYKDLITPMLKEIQNLKIEIDHLKGQLNGKTNK